MKLIFLGTGTSHGIPVIACRCAICKSRDHHNTRTRSSVLVTNGSTQVVIDTGPDLRTQMIREKITWLDAVFQTHDHAVIEQNLPGGIYPAYDGLTIEELEVI